MPKYSADFITKLQNEQSLNPLNFNMFIEIVVFIELKVGDKMKEKIAGTAIVYNFENVIDIRFAPFAPHTGEYSPSGIELN